MVRSCCSGQCHIPLVYCPCSIDWYIQLVHRCMLCHTQMTHRSLGPFHSTCFRNKTHMDGSMGIELKTRIYYISLPQFSNFKTYRSVWHCLCIALNWMTLGMRPSRRFRSINWKMTKIRYCIASPMMFATFLVTFCSSLCQGCRHRGAMRDISRTKNHFLTGLVNRCYVLSYAFSCDNVRTCSYQSLLQRI